MSDELVKRLDHMAIFCEPGCYGRCVACPSDVAQEANAALAAKDAEIARLRMIATRYASGPTADGDHVRCWLCGAVANNLHALQHFSTCEISALTPPGAEP